MIPHVEELEPRCTLDAAFATGAFSAAVTADGHAVMYTLFSDAKVFVSIVQNGQPVEAQTLQLPIAPQYMAAPFTTDLGSGPVTAMGYTANVATDSISGKAIVSWHEGLKTFEVSIDPWTMSVGQARLVIDAAATPPPVGSPVVAAIPPDNPILIQFMQLPFEGLTAPPQTPAVLFVESVQVANGMQYVGVVRTDDFGFTFSDVQWVEFDKFWAAWPN